MQLAMSKAEEAMQAAKGEVEALWAVTLQAGAESMGWQARRDWAETQRD